MGRKISAAIICLLYIATVACKKGESGPVAPTDTLGHRVSVVCEGSLGNGNSALSLYLPDKDSAYEDVYKSANGSSIGDIFQSMLRVGDNYLLCVNNSDKIIAIRRGDWKYAGSIPVPKPRYIQAVSDTRAYVSSLFGNKVYVINPRTLQVTDTITMPYKNTEGMYLNGSTLYVCTWDTATSNVYTINITTNAVGSAVAVGGRAPQEIVKDKEGMLWMLSGNVAAGKGAVLSRVDPLSNTVVKTYAFPAKADPVRLVFNAAGDTLYFIEVDYNGSSPDNGVYRMGIHDAALPAQAFVAAHGLQYFWGLGIDPATGLIYIGDPLGFTQRGKVYVYKADGSLVKTFATGVGPGHFLFD